MKKSAILKSLDSLFGPAACAVMSRPQRNAQKLRLGETEGPVLVIRPGGMGDAVMLLPMLFALREAAPGRRVDILCESRNEAVFNFAFPGCATVCYDRAPFAALKLLRRNKYACVFDTEQFHNFSGVMTALTRAPLRIGFKINTKRRGLYTHLVGYDLDGAEDAQFGRLLDAACGRVVTLPKRFNVMAVENEKLKIKNEKRIVVHAGGSVTSKRCPAEVVAEAVAKVAVEQGLDVVIVGGAGDVGYAGEIGAELQRRECLRHIDNQCGKLTLTETAEICAGARALVGPDSGIAHLAVALGTPAIVLFGPSDPDKWGPPEGAGKIVRVDLPCSPCSIFGYTKPCANHECVKGIKAEMISEALEAVLPDDKIVKTEDIVELRARFLAEHP